MHKGKQVGFIQHENNNIDKVMHNGNCVFEQGYPRDNNTITGDIVLDGTIGKSLKSWSITGNTVQNGTPSPDNPVEIQSVGERTKNLFDKNDATVPGYIDKSGSVRVISIQWFTLVNFIECSGIISISAQNGLGREAYVACYDENKTFLGTVIMSSDNSTTATLTLLDGTVYIKACSRNNSLDTFMLNLGDTPLPYEPYGYKLPIVSSTNGIEPITTPIYYLSEPLRKLGDYADTIEYVGNGQAKITRNIKSLTLTGTEDWKFQSVNDYGIYNFYINTESGRGGRLVICNNFITQTTLIADTQTIGLYLSKDTPDATLYLRVDNTIATDVDTLKSWLAAKYNSGSPVIVEYVLGTPTEEIIEVPQIPTFRNTPTIRGIMTSLSVDTTIKPSATNVSFRSTNKYQRFISRYIDFDNNKMSTISGDFSNIRAFTNRRRCNVLDDGTISAFYGDDNYVEDGSNGQVMVYQPKFYYKVEPIRLEPITDSIGYHIREAIYSVSDIPLTGYKLHPAFINEAGNEVDYFCLSAFEGCAYDVSNSAYITNDSQTVDFTANTGDKLSSIANVKPMSGLTQQLTRPNSEIIAKNRGAGWHTYGIKQASANQMLMFIEYGNLQSNIGSGVVSITDNTSYNCSSYTGSTSSLGNTTGRATSTINEIGGTETTYTDNGKTSISYRGMENPYGNIWDFVYGVNIHGDGTQRGGIPYVCTDYNYAESKNSGNYVSAGFTTVNSSRYIKAFGYGNPDYDWLFIGSDTGGASNGIIGDYHYVTANLNGYRVALLGGHWNDGSAAGGFYWNLDLGVGNRRRTIGVRLCYVPQS